MTRLSIEHLDIHHGPRALVQDLSLSLEAGEVLALVGESGSGKSLSALAVMGLLPQGFGATGRILLDGDDLLTQDETSWCRRRGADLGLVFQEPMTALNPLMRIDDQVAEVLRQHRALSRRDAHAQAVQALARVGLAAPRVPATRYPHELSGGQRQRVAIAMAMVLYPKVLIADEPTTALDSTTQAQILDLLVQLARKEGIGLLLITHDLALVAQRADRVAVMWQGRLVEAGPTGPLLSSPSQPYTRRLLDDSVVLSVPRPGRRADGDPVLSVQSLVREHPGPRRWRGWGPRSTQRTLDAVSFEVRAGECVGLVGESGSGKSTLVRTLLALERPQGGEVWLQGQRLDTARGAVLRSLRRRVQAVFQDPFGSFDPQWTVGRIVAEPFHLLDTPPPLAEQRQRVAEVLTRVGLSATDAERLPHAFSGGQRQRIALARALVIEPDLIVFDEALSALDVSVRAQVLALLAEIARERPVAYLFVSHDLAVVQALTGRVLVMEAGRLVESGDTDKVLAAPTHPATRRLLAAAPALLGRLHTGSSAQSTPVAGGDCSA